MQEQKHKRIIMNKLYLFFAIVALIVGAGFYGANVADANCRADMARQNIQNLQNFQNQVIKNKRINHEIVYKTGVDDIRRILCDKYSIAE